MQAGQPAAHGGGHGSTNDGAAPRSMMPADPRISAMGPLELRQNVLDKLIADGHLRPSADAEPAAPDAGPGAGGGEDEDEYPDECYLDYTFQPAGDMLLGLHAGLTDVDLTGNKLSALPADLAQLTPLLRRLVLRDNLLPSTGPVGGLTRLTHLDLYQNELRAAGELAGLASLAFLDLSFNGLRDLQVLGLDVRVHARRHTQGVHIRRMFCCDLLCVQLRPWSNERGPECGMDRAESG